jgi:hypothetical protein
MQLIRLARYLYSMQEGMQHEVVDVHQAMRDLAAKYSYAAPKEQVIVSGR